MITKQQLLDGAEIADAWRIFPRAFMSIYIKMLWDMHMYITNYQQWYVMAVWAAMTAMTAFYVKSGRSWV